MSKLKTLNVGKHTLTLVTESDSTKHLADILKDTVIETDLGHAATKSFLVDHGFANGDGTFTEKGADIAAVATSLNLDGAAIKGVTLHKGKLYLLTDYTPVKKSGSMKSYSGF